MPGTPTPNAGFTLPTVSGDNNSWGVENNGNWALADQFAVAQVASVSSPYVATVTLFPEFIIRVTTGGLTIPVTLPTPSLVQGKIFLVKKVDTGVGTVNIIGTIDGQAGYLLTNAYQYVRLYANAVGYDVIGNN